MKKYFTLPFFQEALKNLQNVDSKWLIIPLVLAANDVTTSKKVICNNVKGTGRFLKQFFDGKQIGIEPREHGGSCNIRPGNPDPRHDNNKLITVDYSDLWGKTYSQSGYGDWQDGRILMYRESGERGTFQLGPNFSEIFRTKIDPSFKFEYYLTWLYAFTGIPESVNSWEELFNHFKTTYMVNGMPTEYDSVFSLSNTITWPETALVRPTDEELQMAFLPEMVSTAITPASLLGLRDALQRLISDSFLELTDEEIKNQANSIISGLQSTRRLFLYGDPGTGKTELARLVGTAFEDVFTSDRVHTVFVPIADSTTTDKLIGFSTLDGSWINGILTQTSGNPQKELLYSLSGEGGIQERRQINLLILDEANRCDIEELLVKFQASLDSESTEPNHADFRIALDNAGEKRISPNTFLIMTGNSPREDSGRVVQSRPFKRRHNILFVENVFRRVLVKPRSNFTTSLVELWDQVGLALRVDNPERESFKEALSASEHTNLISFMQELLIVIDKHTVGISFGLVKKVLKTAGMRFSLTKNFMQSFDFALTEAIFPMLAAEEPHDGKSLKNSLEELPSACQVAFPVFFSVSKSILRNPDSLGRIRPFL